MPHALFTEIARTVKGSLARFLAIAGIVALGCGFFAGLKMASPDMQEAAHTFYANQHLYDLRVISTLGLSEKDVHALASVEGVEAVMPSRTVDVMATLTSSQSTARVSSFRPGELNQPIVVEGRLPQGPYECVMSADPKKRAGWFVHGCWFCKCANVSVCKQFWHHIVRQRYCPAICVCY